MRVDLKTIILLSAEGKQNLMRFNETGINNIDFAAYTEEVQSYSVFVERVFALSEHSLEKRRESLI